MDSPFEPSALSVGRSDGRGTNPCLTSICNHLGALRATIKAS